MDTHQDDGFNRIYENIIYRQVTEQEAVEVAQKYNIVGFPTLLIYKADSQFDTIPDDEKREIQVQVLSKLKKTTDMPEESKQQSKKQSKQKVIKKSKTYQANYSSTNLED